MSTDLRNNASRNAVNGDGLLGRPTVADSGDDLRWVTLASLRPTYDIRDFGTVVAGQDVDSSGMVQAAINAALAGGIGGTVVIPPGVWRWDTGVTIPTAKVRLVGAYANATVINYYGSGTAILVTALGVVAVEDLRVDNTGGQGLIGLRTAYAFAGTSFRYTFRSLRFANFLQRGVSLENNEFTLMDDVEVQGGGVTDTGFYLSTDAHLTPTAVGISNTFIRSRAQYCTNRGWDIRDQQGSSFINCQALGNGNIQARISGTCRGLTVTAFDVENVGGNFTTTGLEVSGSEHTLSIVGVDLLRGIQLLAATNCVVLPSSYSSVGTKIEVGPSSLNCLILDPHSEVSNNSQSTVVLNGGGSRLTTWVQITTPDATTPPAPVTGVRMFTEVVGGKTRLMGRFPSGASQVISTEP